MNDIAPVLPVVLLLAPPFVLVVWFVATRNRLVSLVNQIHESWSDVNSELQRRYDLIPNLVESVKGYAAHERAVIETVVAARERALQSVGDPSEQAIDENGLVRSLRQMLALAESYPQLKADRSFLELQKELTNTEDRIQACRRLFNGNVRDYNNLVGCFPSNIVAGASGFSPMGYFQIDDIRATEPAVAGFSL